MGFDKVNTWIVKFMKANLYHGEWGEIVFIYQTLRDTTESIKMGSICSLPICTPVRAANGVITLPYPLQINVFFI